ncbi:hypothetical protein ACH0B6_20350 [Solibacillus silvestris]
MLFSVIFLVMGLGFLALSIRHNAKIHSDEGIGGTGTIIWDFLALLLDKLPFWVTKIILILIGLGCLLVSFIYFIK